jgi:hypothetical protein
VSLPKSLTVPALKRRIGKELSHDDALLGELLEGALKQAQAPAPLGTGRLLIPDPPLDSDGNDTGDAVERTFVVHGRHLMIPDAREIASVVVDGKSTSPTAIEEYTGYTTRSRDEVVIRLTLAREHRHLWDADYCGRPTDARQHTVTVTGKFGFAELPKNIEDGIYALAAQGWHEMQAGYGYTGQVTEDGTALQVFRFPSEYQRALRAYQLPPGLVGLA